MMPRTTSGGRPPREHRGCQSCLHPCEGGWEGLRPVLVAGEDHRRRVDLELLLQQSRSVDPVEPDHRRSLDAGGEGQVGVTRPLFYPFEGVDGGVQVDSPLSGCEEWRGGPDDPQESRGGDFRPEPENSSRGAHHLRGGAGGAMAPSQPAHVDGQGPRSGA